MIALTGTLEKDTALQVGFVLFLSYTRNRENLVASLRSSAVQGEGGGGEDFAAFATLNESREW